MLEGIFPDDRDMYRTVKGFIIECVLAGYRQVFSGCKEMTQQDVLVYRIMTFAIDTMPKARLYH